MNTRANQIDVEQVARPGVAAPAEQQPASAVAKEKKPRKPSKKTQALIDIAWNEGVSHGLNVRDKAPTGLWVWLGIAFVAGAVAYRFIIG